MQRLSRSSRGPRLVWRTIVMSPISLVEREAHWQWPAAARAALQSVAPRAAAPGFAAEEEAPGQPRDVLESLLLHGDCAFLLDLWAL